MFFDQGVNVPCTCTFSPPPIVTKMITWFRLPVFKKDAMADETIISEFQEDIAMPFHRKPKLIPD